MKIVRLFVMVALLGLAACILPQHSQAGAPVSIGVAIGVPAPVVAYPAPVYYPPYYGVAPVYGPPVVVRHYPHYGYRHGYRYGYRYWHHRPYHGHYRHFHR